MSSRESLAALRTEIEVFGGPDKYIDADEEAQVFERAKTLGIERPTAEALLNQMCLDGNWTREQEIVNDLQDLLDEAAKGGAISKGDFEHCVNYAVSMNMPRRDAMQCAVKHIKSRSLNIKKGWIGKNWFEEIRRQYES
jgi:hypothetical protein